MGANAAGRTAAASNAAAMATCTYASNLFNLCMSHHQALLERSCWCYAPCDGNRELQLNVTAKDASLSHSVCTLANNHVNGELGADVLVLSTGCDPIARRDEVPFRQ